MIYVSCRTFYIKLKEKWLYERDLDAPSTAEAANLVANGGDTIYGVSVIKWYTMIFFRENLLDIIYKMAEILY